VFGEAAYIFFFDDFFFAAFFTLQAPCDLTLAPSRAAQQALL
jgi:hypothetical protein